MKAFFYHFTFEFKSGIRKRQLLFLTYLFPLGFYLMMGAIMPQLNTYFLEGMIPAMTVFAILAAAFLGIPDPLVNNREKGIYRSFRIHNVPVISILIIPAVTTMIHLAIVTAIITLTAPLLFHASLPLHWGPYILSFLLTSFACISLAMLIGIISSSSRTSVMWSQLIFIPSMLIGGLMIPLSMLPPQVTRFAQILPAAHGMNLFTSLAWDGTKSLEPVTSAVVLALVGVLSFGLASLLFKWDKGGVGKGN